MLSRKVMFRFLSGMRSALLSALLLVAPVVSAYSLNVTVSDPASPVMLSPSQSKFTLYLETNPSTGYGWFLSDISPSGLLKPVGYRLIQNRSDGAQVGAPALAAWEFELAAEARVVPRVFSIQFEYKRPWLLEVLRSVRYVVVASPAELAHQ